LTEENEDQVDRLKKTRFILNKKLEELKNANSRLKELIKQLELENKSLRREIREMIEQFYIIKEETFEEAI
jgi:hypothetical protein